MTAEEAAVFDLSPGDESDGVVAISLRGMVLFAVPSLALVCLRKRDPAQVGMAVVLGLAAVVVMVLLGARAQKRRRQQAHANSPKLFVDANQVFVERAGPDRGVTRQRISPGKMDKLLWQLSVRYTPTLRCPALRLSAPDGPLIVGAKVALWDPSILPTDHTPYMTWPSAPVGKRPDYLIPGARWQEFVGRLVSAGFSTGSQAAKGYVASPSR